MSYLDTAARNIRNYIARLKGGSVFTVDRMHQKFGGHPRIVCKELEAAGAIERIGEDGMGTYRRCDTSSSVKTWRKI